MTTDNPVCDAPLEIIKFTRPLPHVVQSVRTSQRLKVVAIGSSSTQGFGTTDPRFAYPARLQDILSAKFSEGIVVVLNKGQGGEEAGDELKRFERDVIDEKPDLVIWQVGTNAVWKNYDLDATLSQIRQGVQKLKPLDLDCVLMDLQYTPALLDNAHSRSTEYMVEQIGAVAEAANINVFRRFALMKHLSCEEHIGFDKIVSPLDPDKLHQSDWSYNCLAEALALSILDALAINQESS